MRDAAPVAPSAIPGASQGPPGLPLREGLILAGGGTGGHLTPGLALAECALERDPALEVLFFRTRRRIEDRVFAPVGLAMEVRELDLPPPGRTPLSWARFVLAALSAASAVRREIRRMARPPVVALGGYPSFPAILAARLEGAPIVLLEQNRTPGKVVRLAERWASLVACRDEAAARYLLRRRRGRGMVVATGNPLRGSVLLAADERRARRASMERSERRTVLVAGGSQGARGVNRAVLAALGPLGGLGRRISWIHVTGPSDRETVEESYRRSGLEARVFDYTPDLPALYAEADLAIVRAGGTTVSELAAIGVPAVLVPYPHHRDRHQHANAATLAEAGAALVVPEEALEARLPRLLEEVLFDDARLRAMEEAARSAARPGASRSVLDLVARLRGEKGT